MNVFAILQRELIGFFGIAHWMKMSAANDYSSLATYDGFTGAVGPLLPLLLVVELIRALVHKNFKARDYKLIFFTYVLNRVLGSYISIAAMAFSIGLFQPHALFQSRITWYWLIYGYIVWELGHFIYHYLAHKVRLLWCLHSTHHSPESMNLFVSHAHFFLEAPYADVVRTSVCMLLGVSPPLLFVIMFIDGTWGMFIHAGENLIRDGRLGFLNRMLLTPSHHRVHHSRNPLYIDTNFCNLLNVWDRVFGTLQDEHHETPPEYGITRAMKPGSFWDFYFGELVALFVDVKNAPGLRNKLAYIVMPPGWSHTGEHKTASAMRRTLRAGVAELSRVHRTR
ncbi:MAG: sterol desaturase family protein [Gemmatimonadaceae bacterium]|nr:sterol desaturase family protein [Gemmatimonadaceae bacterium]